MHICNEWGLLLLLSCFCSIFKVFVFFYVFRGNVVLNIVKLVVKIWFEGEEGKFVFSHSSRKSEQVCAEFLAIRHQL